MRVRRRRNNRHRPSRSPADLEPVEIAYDDVEVGQAPDIQAQIEKDAAQKSAGLTDLEQKAVDNNLKIKQYNNAPADFPTFVREGYDVKVITPPGYVTQEDGLVYKDFKLGEGTTPEDGQEVTFEYVAYNENGGTIDSTFRKGVPASTRLGINGMIPGFEEAIKGMKAGGVSKGGGAAGARAADRTGDVLLGEAVGGVRHRAAQGEELRAAADGVHDLHGGVHRLNIL